MMEKGRKKEKGERGVSTFIIQYQESGICKFKQKFKNII